MTASFFMALVYHCFRGSVCTQPSLPVAPGMAFHLAALVFGRAAPNTELFIRFHRVLETLGGNGTLRTNPFSLLDLLIGIGTLLRLSVRKKEFGINPRRGTGGEVPPVIGRLGIGCVIASRPWRHSPLSFFSSYRSGVLRYKHNRFLSVTIPI